MNMEAPKSEAPKLPDMVMCGDHPSFTKTELNVKTDTKVDDKEKDKVKEKTLSYAKITPSGSRTERAERLERSERCDAGESRTRATSEHTLRLSEARRRVRSLEVVQRPDVDVQATGNRALVQGRLVSVEPAAPRPGSAVRLRPLARPVCPTAALGSFRWPPYLLCVWVLVLVLTHVLHCLVSLLERALPALRKCSQFFRSWTEATWRSALEPGSTRALPAGLALLTALLYALYFALYAAYAVVLWAIEPLCADDDKRDLEPKVTNYDDYNSTASCKP